MSIESRVIQSVKPFLSGVTLVLAGRDGNVPESDYCYIEQLTETSDSTEQIQYSEGRFYTQTSTTVTFRFTFNGKSDGESDYYSKLLQNIIRTHEGKKSFRDNGFSINRITNRLRINEFLDTGSFVRYVLDMTMTYHDCFEFEDDVIESISTESTLVGIEEINKQFTVIK